MKCVILSQTPPKQSTFLHLLHSFVASVKFGIQRLIPKNKKKKEKKRKICVALDALLT